MNVRNLLRTVNSSRSVINYSKLYVSSRVIGSSAFSRRLQTATESVSVENEDNCKPFSAIPKEKGLPYFGTFLTSTIKNLNQLFLVSVERVKKHGKIWRERRFPGKVFDAVFVIDPKDVQEMFKTEGKIPHRANIPGFQEVRKASAGPEGEMGLIYSDGEKWLSQRQSMSRYMMMPKMVNLYYEDFNAITHELVEVLTHQRNPERNGRMDDIENILFKWAFESTSKFVLGNTFGALGADMSVEGSKFIDSVHQFNIYSGKVAKEPPFLRRFIKTKNLKGALKAQDDILRMGAKVIQAKMTEIDKMSHEELENTDKHDFLTFMLTKGGVKMSTLIQNTLDLLFAGVETSAYTFLCVLYCVATHPDIQVRLREEITSVVGDSVNVTPEHIHRLTLLKNCIKESQRLHPIVPMHGRIVQSDVVLSGYKVPSGTLVMIPTYACSRHPGNFYQPDDFIPDRWLEDDVSRFGSLPFSFGARTCIGRRVAELVIRIALTQIVRRFDLSYLSTEPIHLGSQKLLILPDRPVILGLKDAKA